MLTAAEYRAKAKSLRERANDENDLELRRARLELADAMDALAARAELAADAKAAILPD